MEASASDEAIVAALHELVRDRIGAGTFVILEAGSRPYYVQFAYEGGRLHCEAVSNEYLDAGEQLDDEQMRVLENLGWRPPEHEGQNWFRTFRPESEAEFAEIVALARRAFVEVYRLPADAPVALTTSWGVEEPGGAADVRFAGASHRRAYEQVLSSTVELLGDAVYVDPRRPVLFVRLGSAMTTITVNPLDDDSSLVEFHSWVVTQVPGSPELADYLLKTNYRLPVGAFALDGDGDVVLKHVVLGDTLSQQELQRVLATLIELADDYDDEIRARFGGLRAIDRPHR